MSSELRQLSFIQFSGLPSIRIFDVYTGMFLNNFKEPYEENRQIDLKENNNQSADVRHDMTFPCSTLERMHMHSYSSV